MLRDPFDRFDLSDVTDDVEYAARLHGVMAMLALPQVRQDDGSYRRREVEIEIDSDVWQIVESASFDHERVTFRFGMNGTARSWTFDVRRCPRWRVDARYPRRMGPRFGATP